MEEEGTVSFKNVHVIKNKEKLWKRARLKEAKKHDNSMQ